MTNVAIVYSSGHGHTRVVAEHIARGAEEVPGTGATMFEIVSNQIGNHGRWHDGLIMEQLAEVDAIVFGAPTYMGSADGLFKLFLDDAIGPWSGQVWKDKIAAGFTNSSSRSGDKLMTLQQLSVFAAQMGMVWVGVGDPPGGNFSEGRFTDVNVNGAWLGLAAQSVNDGNAETAPHPGDRLTAERFGRRIARTTARWMSAAKAHPPRRVSASESQRRNLAGPEEWQRFDD